MHGMAFNKCNKILTYIIKFNLFELDDVTYELIFENGNTYLHTYLYTSKFYKPELLYNVTPEIVKFYLLKSCILPDKIIPFLLKSPGNEFLIYDITLKNHNLLNNDTILKIVDRYCDYKKEEEKKTVFAESEILENIIFTYLKNNSVPGIIEKFYYRNIINILLEIINLIENHYEFSYDTINDMYNDTTPLFEVCIKKGFIKPESLPLLIGKGNYKNDCLLLKHNYKHFTQKDLIKKKMK